MVPEAYIQRMFSYAQQGFTHFVFHEYDTNWDGKAYQTVSGQNSNNSVRIPNEFFAALESDGDWQLKRRTNGKACKTIKARDLWDRIAWAAWICADPGTQYDTTINEWHTCPEDGRINASNPCSEYMFLDDTACNLASLNLATFYTVDGQFELETFPSCRSALDDCAGDQCAYGLISKPIYCRKKLPVQNAWIRLREHGNGSHASRHSLRFTEGFGDVRLNYLHHDR